MQRRWCHTERDGDTVGMVGGTESTAVAAAAGCETELWGGGFGLPRTGAAVLPGTTVAVVAAVVVLDVVAG